MTAIKPSDSGRMDTFAELVSDLTGAGSGNNNNRNNSQSFEPMRRANTSPFSSNAAAAQHDHHYGAPTMNAVDGDEQHAPFEQLVVAFESASNHLPANLASRFHDSIAGGASQLAMLVEQWVATEGPGATTSATPGAIGGGPVGSPASAARARRNSLIGTAAAVDNKPAATSSNNSNSQPRRRASSVTMIEDNSNNNAEQQQKQQRDNDDALSIADNKSNTNSAAISRRSSFTGQQPQQHQLQQQHQHQQQQQPLSIQRIRGAGGSGGGSVGLSTAAKARLRHTLEQGLTDYTTHLHSSILAEIEVVNIASAQVVARGGLLAHQHTSTLQELAAARREIGRIQDMLKEQADRMRVLEGDSTLREDQFDILRQQLTAREEMLRESTNTFRKDLTRYKSRVADLEMELERRRLSGVPVVASLGHRVAAGGGGGMSPTTTNAAGMGEMTFSMAAGSMMRGNITTVSGLNTALGRGGTQSGMNSNTSPSPQQQGRLVSNDPDPRGVLAAAAAMDTIMTSHSSPDPNRVFNEFSFASPGFDHGQDSSSQQEHQQQGDDGGNSAHRPTSAALRRALSPVPQYGVSHLVQVASETGVAEALREQQREFERKLKAVKERYMAERRQAIAQVKAQQDLTIRSLRRDVEERDRELALLRGERK